MDNNKEKNAMLDLLPQPCFCVNDGVITQVNEAAASMLLTPGMEVAPLLLTGQEELNTLSNGCLYLTLDLAPGGVDAVVTPMDGELVFLMDGEGEKELQAFCLASRELRIPLTGIVVATARMHTVNAPDPFQEDLTRLTRYLHQVLRLLANMSDAGNKPDSSRQESTDIANLLDELFQKVQELATAAGIEIIWQRPAKPMVTLTDAQQLERAVLNILSNAMKFTPVGGQIHATLIKKGQTLRLQITDSGCGIPTDIRSTLFSRYKRQPGIEDSRLGLGLGMMIVRKAAANHGGTVLIDQPKEGGTRVTLTMAIRKPHKAILHSPRIQMDYAGEWDHALIELSEVLPPECYQKEI